MDYDNIMNIFNPIFKSIATTVGDEFVKDTVKGIISSNPALVTTAAYCLCGCGVVCCCAYVGVKAYTVIKREQWLQKQMENCEDIGKLQIYANLMTGTS